MDSDRYVCPSCGQPVPMVVRRHKMMGTYVPVWRPGHCENPDCPAKGQEPGEARLRAPAAEVPHERIAHHHRRGRR
ncbi:hypothetical protein [Streptomyces abyssomicinicus]|uniref:hypothetical protein n=1 Tax=Streptomyces abyssomicinicus TaxID=574929 RepID=UPI00125037C9|nr:hypothetical protein [Streptomyces abyssomicinicus]